MASLCALLLTLLTGLFAFAASTDGGPDSFSRLMPEADAWGTPSYADGVATPPGRDISTGAGIPVKELRRRSKWASARGVKFESSPVCFDRENPASAGAATVDRAPGMTEPTALSHMLSPCKYQCRRCNYGFVCRSYWEEHEKTCEGPQQPLDCKNIRGKNLKFKSRRKLHMVQGTNLFGTFQDSVEGATSTAATTQVGAGPYSADPTTEDDSDAGCPILEDIVNMDAFGKPFSPPAVYHSETGWRSFEPDLVYMDGTGHSNVHEPVTSSHHPGRRALYTRERHP